MMMSDQVRSCVLSTVQVEQVKLVKKLLEVTISDDDLKAANFTDGIEIQVIGAKPFTVNAFWIVKIQDLHREIEKNWKTMRDELWDMKFLDKKNKSSLYQNKPQIFQQTNELVKCCIKPPKQIDTSKMTATPRDFYPLVIIVSCHEEEPGLADDIAANIQVIHIKDDIVPIKNHTIKQYTKQVDGKILDISQLFVEESLVCFICFEEANPREGLKLYCLLPCRHSPICSECILRIRDCPKCRCPIASVFDINALPANEGSSTSANGSGIDPNLSYLYDDNRQAMSQRKTGFLASLRSIFGK